MAQDAVIRAIGVLLGLGLTCAYVPQAFADEEVGRWAVGCVLLAVLLWFRKPTPVSWIGVAFLAWAALSLAWAPFPLDGAWEMLHWLFLTGAFVVGANGMAAPVFEGAAYGVAVNSAIAIAQVFGLTFFEQASAPAGLFGNRDIMAEAALVTLVPLLARRRWALAAAQLPALVLPQSRAVLAVGAILALVWGWGRSRLAAGAACAALIAAAIVVTAFKHLHSDEIRLDLWRDTWSGVTWFGAGVGQFYATFPQHAHFFTVLMRPEHAHSDWLEVLYELGPVGLALAGVFAVEIGGGNVVDGWRFAWLAFCGLGAVSFSLHNPTTAVLGFLAGGGVYGSGAVVRRGVVDPANDVPRRPHGRRFFGNPRGGPAMAA